MEVWKQINGYEGLYEASSLGRIKSLAGKRWSGKYADEKILSPSKDPNGYLRLLLYKKGFKRKLISVHRVVCEAFNDNPENKATVNHKDGDKANNQASNLEWATQKENIRHSFKAGLSTIRRGSDVGGSKLSDEMVLEIRNKYSSNKYTQMELAKEYYVCQMTINLIVRNKTWNHLPTE